MILIPLQLKFGALGRNSSEVGIPFVAVLCGTGDGDFTKDLRQISMADTCMLMKTIASFILDMIFPSTQDISTRLS